MESAKFGQCQNSDGIQKRVRTIFKERGLWNTALKLPLAREILSQQPGLLSQKKWLEETLHSEEGYFLVFYPKFHCGFNFIELYWGVTKTIAKMPNRWSLCDVGRVLPGCDENCAQSPNEFRVWPFW
jgi:hypothetical protein